MPPMTGHLRVCGGGVDAGAVLFGTGSHQKVVKVKIKLSELQKNRKVWRAKER